MAVSIERLAGSCRLAPIQRRSRQTWRCCGRRSATSTPREAWMSTGWVAFTVLVLPISLLVCHRQHLPHCVPSPSEQGHPLCNVLFLATMHMPVSVLLQSSWRHVLGTRDIAQGCTAADCFRASECCCGQRERWQLACARRTSAGASGGAAAGVTHACAHARRCWQGGAAGGNTYACAHGRRRSRRALQLVHGRTGPGAQGGAAAVDDTHAWARRCSRRRFSWRGGTRW